MIINVILIFWDLTEVDILTNINLGNGP